MRNDLENTASADAAGSSSGLSRRQVVRTGANLAWAVPAVSLATAVPALAVSGKPNLKIASFNATSTTKSVKLSLGPVTNTGGGDAGALKAKFTVPGVKVTKVKASSGWKPVGSPKALLFVSSTTTLEKGDSTMPLTVTATIVKEKKKPKGTAKVVVTGKGDTAADTDTF